MISDKNWILVSIFQSFWLIVELRWMAPTPRLLPAWFNVRKFSLILKYEVKIDAVTCSRVHSGLWSIRILMLPHCWSLQSHAANTDPPLAPVKNNFSSVYWTGKSQYLGQIRDHLIGVECRGEKWIYIIGAWIKWHSTLKYWTTHSNMERT